MGRNTEKELVTAAARGWLLPDEARDDIIGRKITFKGNFQR